MTEIRLKNNRELQKLRNNLGAPAERKPDSAAISDLMTALQVAGSLALDLAGVKGKARRDVLLSGKFSRHCLKAARELAMKARK